MHHFNQHSVILKVHVVMHSYLHAEQTRPNAYIMQLINNNGRSEALWNKGRRVTLTWVSNTCLCRSWPFISFKKSQKSAICWGNNFTPYKGILKVWRSVTFALARLKQGDKRRLARQKKSTNTYASVRYHYLKSGCRIQRLCSGDSGIVFAVQTPFKTRYLACSCWLQLVWRRSNDMIWLRLIGSVQWQNWVCDKEKRCFSFVLVRKSRQRYFEPHLTALREL